MPPAAPPVDYESYDTAPAGAHLSAGPRPAWDEEFILDRVLQREGAWANDPRDTPTHYGITQQTYSDWIGRPASIEDMKAITPEVAREIYRKNYLYGPKIAELPDQFRRQVFDWGVVSGPGNAIRILQETLNRLGSYLKVDSTLGPDTIANAEYQGRRLGPALNNALADAFEQNAREIVERQPRKRYALESWLRRINSFRDPYLR